MITGCRPQKRCHSCREKDVVVTSVAEYGSNYLAYLQLHERTGITIAVCRETPQGAAHPFGPCYPTPCAPERRGTTGAEASAFHLTTWCLLPVAVSRSRAAHHLPSTVNTLHEQGSQPELLPNLHVLGWPQLLATG